MLSNGFYCCVSEPTRPSNLPNKNGSLIDHIWCNLRWKVKSQVVLTDFTDHHSNTTVFNINCIPPLLMSIKYRLNNNKCKEKLLNNIENANFTFICDDQININEKYNKFHSILNESYNNSHPIKEKQITEKRLKNPWLTSAILNSIDQRHKLYKNYKRNIIPKEAYLNLHNKLESVLNKAKKQYYYNKLNEVKDDPKRVWNVINNTLNKKINKTNEIEKLKVGDDLIVDKKSMANEFNKYFSTVGKKTADWVPLSDDDFRTYLSPPQQTCFRFKHISHEDVVEAINQLKNKKALLIIFQTKYINA